MGSTDLKQSCAGVIEMSKGWAKEIIRELKPDLYRILSALGEKSNLMKIIKVSRIT